MVSQLARPVDGQRRKSLQGDVTKVQVLVVAVNLGWGVVASSYTVHGGDEVLWTVRRVDVDMNGTDVAGVVLKNLEAVWGVGSEVGCWVDNTQSTYVVVGGILEREWLSDVGRTQSLVGGNTRIMWGPRQPVVVSRAWKRVDVKVELMTGEAARGAVIRGLVYCGMRQTVHMAVGGGGASVARLVHGTDGGRLDLKPSVWLPIGRPTRTVEMGGLQLQVGTCFRCLKLGHWKNECPDQGAVSTRGCFTGGWKGNISRDCPRRAGLDVQATRGIKDKGRADQGPEERRIEPSESGWLEAKNTFFDDERVWKTMEEVERTVGPSGVRS